MDLFQALILALIQGITEFLPISSSAHLILPSKVLGWPDQGLAFDVAVHVGSLVAVVFYFRRDLIGMVGACFSSVLGRSTAAQNVEARLAWMVCVATLPTVIVALLSSEFIEQHLRSATVIACTTILFGLLLAVAELNARHRQTAMQMTWFIAIAIGFAQVLALIPGTSRSGITMTAAVLLGLSRTDAARFSFLLSIPIIVVAGLFLVLQIIESTPVFSWSHLAIAMLVSALSAWACIALFLKLIERIGLMPFVWYRMALGLALFAFVVA